MTPPRATRCALYLRVSTARQLAGNSLATQESQLLRYVRARGYAVADLYVDAGQSGKNTDRPELQRMLDDARRRCFDVVLVWAVDRISRSLPDLLRLIDTLREHGVDFVAVSQDFDTSDPAGLLTVHILGSFAQFERELLVERIREGHRRRLHTRPFACGTPPYGYRREGGELVEDPDAAPLVRRIFRLYLEKKSARAVATQLNEEGVRARNGGLWRSHVLGNMLRNPVYAAANVHGRRVPGSSFKPKEEWIVVPGMREPLVDPGVFGAAQELLQRDRRPPKRESHPRLLLTGIARCGKCGGPMCGSLVREPSGMVRRYYECNASKSMGKAACEGLRVEAGRLGEAVVAKALAVAGSRAVGPHVEDSDGEEKGADDERRELGNGIERVRYRMSRTFELYEMGDIDKVAFTERMAELTAERQRLEVEIGALRREDAVPKDTPRLAASTYEALDEWGRRDFLRALIRVVIVHEKSAELVLAHCDGNPSPSFSLSLLPSFDASTFEGRLKNARIQAGLRQEDVARLLGVHPSTVSDWECGRHRPQRQTVEAIERVIHGAASGMSG